MRFSQSEYQSVVDNRRHEAEQAKLRMDTHGEIITQDDIEAWREHLRKINSGSNSSVRHGRADRAV